MSKLKDELLKRDDEQYIKELEWRIKEKEEENNKLRDEIHELSYKELQYRIAFELLVKELSKK